MKYDFIEIGTSNFHTLIENADDNTVGISIEPMKKYLDELPSPKNVVKLNCAISFDGSEAPIAFYYLHPDIIKRHKLKPFMKGCNSIGTFHPMHVKHNVENLVTIDNVQQRSLRSVINEFKVTELDYLKVDTEGGDCKIMKQLYNLTLRPKKIKFETNSLANPADVANILDLFSKIGYDVSWDNEAKRDTILTLAE